MPEVFRITVDISPPNSGDGQITEGFYTIADGLLVMTDPDGSPVNVNEIAFQHQLRPDDNHRAIAAVLTKKVRLAIMGISPEQEAFNRPIKYANLGVA